MVRKERVVIMKLSEQTVGVIGAGNMATAIVKGLLSRMAPERITVSDRSEEQLKKIAAFGVCTIGDNVEAAQKADIVVLAVKPNIYPAVLEELKEFTDKLYLTIAPGLSIAYIKSFFNAPVRVVRTMPNMPAQINRGMTAYTYESPVSEEDAALARELLSCLGDCVYLEEKLLNGAVAVNGSGPAYVFMMIEAMADGAVAAGIPRQEAYRLAAKTVEGSAAMVAQTGLHPAQLKDMVCSPAGTTIEAVKVLEQRGFRAALMEAMKSCAEKSEAMGK